MNPTTTDQLPPPPPQPLPSQPLRSSFSCDRHPEENFSGFCPLCLCERLTTLDQSANTTTASSSSRRNSTSSATTAIKSLFKLPSSSNSSLFPELRRTKSFSASKNELFASVFEPQRRSCDVRALDNALSTLFNIDDENRPRQRPVLEANKEEEEEHQFPIEQIEFSKQNIDVCVNESNHNIVEEIDEIQEEDDEIVEVEELKTMQDHIDLDSQSKKSSKSNFWSAASSLGKKWQKWKGKLNKGRFENGAVSSSTLPVERPILRQYRETRSEIADYGYGRRSCDIDPRFSLDAGRISVDDPTNPRYSFDEPRPSWDGYVMGRTFPRLPPMVEDVPVVQVPRSDMQIAVEQAKKTDEFIPGGSIQTREYYTDSSSKRRKSLDRSNSIRKMAAAVVAEMDESHETKTTTTPVSNAKVSPATIDYNYNYGHGGLGLRFPSIGCERELARDSNSTSLRNDCSETFELGLRDGEKKDCKKPRKWKWKLWGFIHRRGGNKDDEDDQFSRVNGVERSYSESWQETGFKNKLLFRSNSTVSCRNSSYNMRKSSSEINGFASGKSKKIGGDEFVLERTRSAKYSPSHTDSGLLRFYLTPLRGSRRSKPIGNPNPIPRNAPRLH